MKGVVISKANWNGERIFSVTQYLPSKNALITEAGLDELHAAGFSNIGTHEAGVIKG